MAKINVRIESARGCGYRKPGGKYLVGGSDAAPCCKLPFPLTVCSCCGAGIKQSRGFTWISTDLFCSPPSVCKYSPSDQVCPMSLPGKKIGLLWVGEKYYPSTHAFKRESAMQGISKRIAQIPRDLVIGETWVSLAHKSAIVEILHYSDGSKDYKKYPGIFMVFKPTAIEYVITGKETDQQLDDMITRGITLVDVIRATESQMKIEL
jgi:hypothetical protein